MLKYSIIPKYLIIPIRRIMPKHPITPRYPTILKIGAVRATLVAPALSTL